MTKTFLTTVVFFSLLSAAFAQKNTHIGVEGAINHDVYEILDNGNLLKKVPLISGYVGINVRQDLSTTLFVETGLLRKMYNEGIGFKVFSGYTEGNAINAWLIPLRLGSRINIHKQKVHLVPVIGYTFSINSDYGYGDGGIGGYEMNSKDTVYHSGTSRLSLTNTFPLLQTGMGFEFKLLRKALLSLSANYYTGFKNVIGRDIVYTHNTTSYTAKGLSKGEFFSFGLSVKYPINQLWRTKN